MNKIFPIILLAMMLCVVGATALTYTSLADDFSGSIQPWWENFGSGAVFSMSASTGVLRFNGSGSSNGNGIQTIYNFSTAYPIHITFAGKNTAFSGATGGSASLSNTTLTNLVGITGSCMLETRRQASTPTDLWYDWITNPSVVNAGLGSLLDTNWHQFKIDLYPSGSSNYVEFRTDGSLISNATITSVCNNRSDLRFRFAYDSFGGSGEDFSFDNFTISGYSDKDAFFNVTPTYTECVVSPTAYFYPVLWYEPFNYNGEEITSHGWSGYPWIIGNNWLDTCNELYAPTAISTQNLTYNLQTAYNQPITFTWDMWGSSDNNNGSYSNELQATIINLLDSDGNPAISLQFAYDGIIYFENQTSYPNWEQIVGNWQGAGWMSYKLVIRPSTQTFDFYFTNQTANPFGYYTGCIDCEFTTPTDNIKAVQFEPIPFTPPMPENANWGLWLDELKIVDTSGAINLSTDNYCNFADCIFYDPFTYTDSTGNHGWFLFEATPTEGYIKYENNTYGYYFQHDFDTFRNTDAEGVVTFQFRALFPEPPGSTSVDIVNFDVTNAFSLEFTKNSIIDIASMNALGTYNYNTWNTYTIVLDLVQNTYDLYIDKNKVVAGQPITITTQVSRLGFWVNDPASVYIDQMLVAKGIGLLSAVTTDTGVPSEHLRNCWSSTNGSFDWTCCTAQERISKSGWCPVRVTGFYLLGGITTFVLTYFLYFIIIVIIVVILIPFFVPKRN